MSDRPSHSPSPTPPPDATLLRERSVVELIDAAFVLARRHYPPLLVLSALMVAALAPLYFAYAIAGEGVTEDWPPGIAGFAYETAVQSFFGGAIVSAVADVYLGRPLHAGRSLAEASRRVPALVLGGMAATLLMMVGGGYRDSVATMARRPVSRSSFSRAVSAACASGCPDTPFSVRIPCAGCWRWGSRTRAAVAGRNATPRNPIMSMMPLATRLRPPAVAALAALLVLTSAGAPALAAQEADLILIGGRVWTGDARQPWAQAVAVRGKRILAVGDSAEVLQHRTGGTTVTRLPGRFIMPGFIDNHTHFDQAGALILGANLLDVADAAALVRRVREARDRLPAGAWITGGDWGAYEAWERGSAGRPDDRPERQEFRPHRGSIDSITAGTPVLLSRWDRSTFLVNERALQVAGATCQWEGVECEGGRMTGRLTPAAAARVRAVIPPKPLEQRLAEARAAQAQLREFGVTTIHDITPPAQLGVYQALERRGELTVRVYARPTLDRWEALRHAGIRHGFGSDWLKVGGLKGFVDGIMGNSSARFHEPYLTTGERGSWRPMMEPAGNMERLLLGADSAGLWPQVHAIGDHAVDTLLDLFERVIRVNGPRDRRFRMIHAQVLRNADVARRMARLGIIAEMQPYHTIDDMRWMEERIGQRARWAYAFRTLHEAGVRLSFGSDWPGTNASWYTANPLHGIYAAVTRQTLEGQPVAGWFPQERIDVETALRAYTVNNAWAAGEEELKGRLAPGLLADIVALDRDPLRIRPEELKDVRVVLTVVDGKVVYEGGGGR